MENTVRLELVEKKDAKDIRDLLTAVYKNELETVFKGKEDALYIPGHGSYEMQKYRTWDNKYYKIMYGNKIAGIVLIYTTGREHARLDLLYILPEYHNKGIGSKTIQLVEQLFSDIKVWQTDTTIHSPRNHHFYEKNGYELVGEDETDRYYVKTIGEADDNPDTYHTQMNCFQHDFRDSNYQASDWYDVNMADARFENMNMRQTIFANIALQSSRFTNTNLSNVVIGDTRINDGEICYDNISNLHIHDINLDDNKETSFHFDRCVMVNSTINDCDLRNLQIKHCNLEGVTIDGISLVELMECYQEKMKSN